MPYVVLVTLYFADFSDFEQIFLSIGIESIFQNPVFNSSPSISLGELYGSDLQACGNNSRLTYSL